VFENELSDSSVEAVSDPFPGADVGSLSPWELVENVNGGFESEEWSGIVF